MTESPINRIDEEIASPLLRFLMKYGIAAIIAVFYATAAMHFDYTPDDTYIYLQYAKHVAAGDGFSFNGNEPSYGVTGPLWVLLIASGVLVGLDPYVVAKTLDLIFASFSILVFYILAFAVIREKLYALVATWIFSFDAWFIRWASSGMETSFAVLLTLLSLLYAYKKEYIKATVVTGALTLVRPEGILLLPVVLLDLAVNGSERQSKKRLMRTSLAVFGGLMLAWFLFAALHFGTILPNILRAKSAQGVQLATILDVAQSTLKILGATQGVSILLLLIGLTLLVRLRGWSILKIDGILLLWALLLPLAYLALNVQVVSRYLLPVVPVVVLYAIWCIRQLEVVSVLSQRKSLLVLVAAAGLALAQNQYVHHSAVAPHVKNFTLGMNECIKPIAYWLRSNAPSDATVLAPDVGLVGYVSDLKIDDTAGLVTPNVKNTFAGLSYDEGMIQHWYDRAVHPNFIIDRSAQPNRLSSPTIQPVMTRIFPELNLSKPEPLYYTLYKVAK